jgi:DNA-binding phage protein
VRTFREYLKETLVDHNEAAVYLNTSLEEYDKDNDREAFLLALRTVSGVEDGISEISNEFRSELIQKVDKKLEKFGEWNES